jgi:hypothetical protein
VKLRNLSLFVLGLIFSLLLVACGSGGGNPAPPPISVSFLNPLPSSLNVSTSASIAAAVANDQSNAGVSWKVTCGSASCGTISPAVTLSGAAATYTSPSTVPNPATVTITATSVTDGTKTVSAAVTINSGTPPPISVSFAAQPPSTLVVNTSTNVTANVSNDAKNGGVNWTVTCGSAQCGTANPASTASGSATTYTAPAAVPSPATVTLTATSVTDNTKSASATITIVSAPPPVLADGTYVYQISGQDNNNSYFVAGAFSIKNGEITGGEQDFTDGTLGSSDQLDANKSSITDSSDGIRVILGVDNTNIAVNGQITLAGTRVSNSRLLVSEYDTFAAATGSIDLQTSTAQPNGGYAFAINGIDNSNDDNQLVIGGVLNFSGGTLSTAGSVFDYNDAADVPLQAQAFASGSVSAADAYGRVVINLTPSAQSGVQGFSLAGYIVDGSRMQLIESLGDSLNADLGGVALSQGAKTGLFGQSDVLNTTYVHGSQGADTNGPLVLGGAFTFGSGGSATGLLAFNDLTNVNGNSFSNASYSVDPTGRVTISNVIPSNMTNISLTFQLYLDGNGNALALGNDEVQETTGLAYRQNGASDYEGTYAINVQGFLNGPQYEQPYGAVGPVTISSDGFDGYTNYTSQDPTLRYPEWTPFDNYSSVPLNGYEDSSKGLLNLSGLNSLGFDQSGSFGYYPIDANRVLAIQVDDGGMGLLILEATNPAASQN